MKDDANYNLFGGRRSAEAIRSTGYKTTGNALGELVDNSIQAGASNIKILVEVRQEKRVKRTRESIVRIGVLDNGCGMDADTLRRSLLFGEGNYFDTPGSLSKYGVGLPQASLSQGSLLRVWSWQNGFDSALATGYDIYDDEWRQNNSQVPEGVPEQVPKPWYDYIDKNKKSGTLVVWSRLDRLSCSSAITLYRNSEFMIGRMYRNWIHDGRVKIEYLILDQESGKLIDALEFRAVDPMYLMENTTVSACNPPVDPMFEKLGDVTMGITYNGKKSDVIIRTSVAKKEIRKKIEGRAAGHSAYGKDAAKNIGLSIVREGRELQLDPNWTATTSNNRDPRHRWWGAEICFGEELDEVFGVTNDKQSATQLSNASNDSFSNYKEDGESLHDVMERLLEEQPRLHINLAVADRIRELIGKAIENIPKVDEDVVPKTQKKGKGSPEGKSTEAVKKQKEDGITGKSDEDDPRSFEEKKKELIDDLKNLGASTPEIDRTIENYVTYGHKFHFVKMDMVGDDSFFNVRTNGGALIVILNSDHLLYPELFGIFDYEKNIESGKKYSAEQLEVLLEDTRNAMKYILVSWARLEDIALKDGNRSLTNNRMEWGRMATSFKEQSVDNED